ncbi:T9SS type A sorting domain-containing protein, partial [candidate division KSB1 bacterium]|nr:T9SS type A sorting domain-containing protein [candidate division KSB1 bacterium]
VFYLKQMAQMYAELEDFKSADKVLADCAKKAKDDPDIPLIQQEIDALRELAAETKGDGKGMAADNPIFFESVKEPESGVLLQNYPNPFNNSTEIQYTLPQAATVTLRIFDITGRLVRILENARYYEAGPHRTIWNGLDDNGRPVASGVYYCRLQFGGPWRNLKLLVLK